MPKVAKEAVPLIEAAPENIEEIVIPEIKVREITLEIQGQTPLIMNRWSEKAKDMMRNKHQKKATTGREKREPEKEFIDATYFLGHNPDRYGFPANSFKLAMIDAAVALNAKKTVTRRAFHVIADAATIDGDMVEIFTTEPPRMREDTVRVGMGSADLRYRPEFREWSAKLKIRYDVSQISVAQLVNLLNKAGFSCGIGEWRCEKDGSNGAFTVIGIE